MISSLTISRVTPTPISPRQLAHRGAISASAIWFEPSLCGEDEMRRRVLLFWQSGARVWEFSGGLLLQFATPQSLRAEAIPGTLVGEREGWLLACPLSDAEWRAVRLEAGSENQTAVTWSPHFQSGAPTLLFPRGGALWMSRDAKIVDPSEWIDVEAWQTIEMLALGEVAAPVLALSETSFEARRALDVPASAELERFLAQMRGETLPHARASWRQKWKALWQRGARDESSARAKNGGMGVRTRGNWLENLFQFRFGAGGAAPDLEKGAHFSSELGLLARPVLLLAGLALAVAFLSAFSARPGAGRDALAFLMASLASLTAITAMAWGFLTLARLIPTPARWAQTRTPQMRTPNAVSAWFESLSSDLLSLIVLCGALIILARSGDWAWVFFGTILTFFLALQAHWKRRRAGGNGREHPTRLNAPGGWLARLLGLFGDGKGASNLASASEKPPKAPRAWGLNALLWRTELSRLFGMRQARHMMAMMQMFERGDLENALRHAVPFNLFEGGDSAPALGAPKARADLDFLGGRSAGGVGVPLPPDIKAALTRHYRAAFETLSRQNRVDEAAFVLAELLDSPLEAVQWLEKHQKWQTAAQLAQSRHLDAGLTVRLWWLSGDKERAIALARRLEAFSDAISRLESGDEAQREAARTLRLLWAQFLARGGNFAGAVEAAWPVVLAAPPLRGVIGVWIERGLENEGPSKARMLGRQAHLLSELAPATREIWRDAVQNLLADESLAGVDARLAFASMLAAASRSDGSRAAARRAVRALTRDAALFPQWSVRLQHEIPLLLRASADSALRADWSAKSLPANPSLLAMRDEAISLEIDAEDRGNTTIWDAALLDDGRTLLALGEGGARLLNREFKVVARFDLPCHRLVMGESGLAIGVALRGLEIQARFEGDNEAFEAFVAEMGAGEWNRRAGLARLCRFDLNRKTVQLWGEMGELSAFSNQVGDGQWMVSAGESLLSIDALAPLPTALWRSGDAGRAFAISQNNDSLAVLTQFHTAGTRLRPARTTRTEMWRFDWPSLVLRARRLVPGEAVPGEANGLAMLPSLTPDGWTLWMPTPRVKNPVESQPIEIVKDWSAKTAVINLLASEKPLQVEQCGAFLCSLSAQGEDLHLRLWAYGQNPPRRCWHLTLRGVSRARFRLTTEKLSLCDAHGRFIVIDLATGAVLKNERLF